MKSVYECSENMRVDIRVELVKTTPLYIVVLNEYGKQKWLEKSCILLDRTGDTVIVTLHRWEAQDKFLTLAPANMKFGG